MSFHPIVPWSVAVLAVAVAWAPQAQAHDLADGYLRARAIVARHLEHAKLNSAYGTPAFDETGRRIGDIFLNFTGQDSQGRWMLMSLTLAPGGSLQGETDPDNPREDRWGHHEKPPVELDAWLPPEEAVATAINLQPGHAPTAGISLAYHQSAEFGNRFAMVLYWEEGGAIRHVTLDARYGRVLEVGESPIPSRSFSNQRYSPSIMVHAKRKDLTQRHEATEAERNLRVSVPPC